MGHTLGGLISFKLFTTLIPEMQLFKLTKFSTRQVLSQFHTDYFQHTHMHYLLFAIFYFNCLMWASIRSHTFVRSTTLR